MTGIRVVYAKNFEYSDKLEVHNEIDKIIDAQEFFHRKTRDSP